jgi:hypothetical protein
MQKDSIETHVSCVRHIQVAYAYEGIYSVWFIRYTGNFVLFYTLRRSILFIYITPLVDSIEWHYSWICQIHRMATKFSRSKFVTLPCFIQTWTVNVQKAERSVAFPRVTARKNIKFMIHCITGQHPMDHRSVENTGSSCNPKKKRVCYINFGINMWFDYKLNANY